MLLCRTPTTTIYLKRSFKSQATILVMLPIIGPSLMEWFALHLVWETLAHAM